MRLDDTLLSGTTRGEREAQNISVFYYHDNKQTATETENWGIMGEKEKGKEYKEGEREMENERTSEDGEKLLERKDGGVSEERE